MTARKKIGLVVALVALLGALAAAVGSWYFHFSPEARFHTDYARAAALRQQEVGKVQPGAAPPPLSDAYRRQAQTLVDQLRRLPGVEGLRTVSECYAAAGAAASPAQVAANRELATFLIDALFADLQSSQMTAARALVDGRPASDPFLRTLLSAGLDNLVTRGPRDYREKHAEAYAAEQKSDFEAAIRSYQQAISIAQNNALPLPEMRAFLGLAGAYKALGRTVDVETACNRTQALLAAAVPADAAPLAQVHYRLSEVYVGIGQAGAAYDALQRALAIDRKHADVNPSAAVLDLLALTTVCGGVGKLDQALEFGAEAMSATCADGSPTRSFCGPAMMNLAGIKAAQSKFDEAEQLYRQAITRVESEQPRPVKTLYMVLHNYSGLLEKLGRKSEAAVVQKRAESLVPPPKGQD
jgi:tetratricopeptide (TPR) repeat protein